MTEKDAKKKAIEWAMDRSTHVGPQFVLDVAEKVFDTGCAMGEAKAKYIFEQLKFEELKIKDAKNRLHLALGAKNLKFAQQMVKEALQDLEREK